MGDRLVRGVMGLRIIAFAAGMCLLLASCGRVTPPAPRPRRTAESFAAEEQARWLRERSTSCGRIAASMKKETGGAALSCSGGRTNQEAIACANEAFAQKRPFTLCASSWGMDSQIE